MKEHSGLNGSPEISKSRGCPTSDLIIGSVTASVYAGFR